MSLFLRCSLFCYIVNLARLTACCTAITKDPTVLIAILVRNKAHTLPYFLSLLERQDYDKKRIRLWIRSDNNIDNSIEILNKWIDSEGEKYHSLNIHLNTTSAGFADEKSPIDWSTDRFRHVIDLREQALVYAREIWADFILMLDADVFLTKPDTLRSLALKNRTVVSPLLRSDGMYSNFWAGMTPEYYYTRTELYEPILFREKIGCHSVPMVHSAVLVDLRRCDSDLLTYKAEKLVAYDGPEDDIITFAVGANKSDVPLFICNDEVYGFVMVPLEKQESIMGEDMQRLINTKVEMLAFNDYLPLSDSLVEFVSYPEKDTLGLDHIFMINLLRRPERRRRMQRLFKELGISAEIIDAVDGRTLNESTLKEWGVTPMPEYSDPYHKRPMTMGEIGCFLSHYVVWQKVLENGYKNVMVLEDDVRFEPFFRQKIDYVLAELSALGSQYDLVYIGRKRLMKSENLVKGSKFLVHAGYSYWTLGYILSDRGARKLVDAMPLEKLIPVDEYLPILSDTHPTEEWASRFPTRDLITLSTNPLLVYPTHYTGEDGHISDTEDSVLVQNSSTEAESRDEL